MTYDEAIASLLETCENLKEAIEQLQEENAFLADTIEKNNLGQIESERRFLLSENEQCKKDADIAFRKAKQIKSEYESKMSEANDRLSDAKKKQSEIDSYIEAEAEKKIENIKFEYEEYKKENDKALKKHKAENDKQLQKSETFYKEKNKKYFIVALASILFAIIGIVINFI
ncbi:MAG: hypothetical protein ACI4D0_08190 [Lachnospira sp.]